MKILFVNSQERRCGVFQFGFNMFNILAKHAGVAYVEPSSKEKFLDSVELYRPDVVIYNWQAGIGGWMAEIPLANVPFKQVLCYHDLDMRFDDFDAILFSDPTMKQHGNWHPIGRPLRDSPNIERPGHDIPVIGINGFIGAWAPWAVAHLASSFEHAHIRLHLPSAVYGDADGAQAHKSAAQVVAALPKSFTYEINWEFLSWDDLIRWLSGNDINCYIRPPEMNWRGVSSACDAAMCARRPIAINSCNAFRHLHDCSPSIMVEHRSIRDILSTGLSPLVPKYAEWSSEVVSGQVMKVLESVVKQA